MTEENNQPSLDRQGVRDVSWPEKVEIFDTTLRDGVQFEGISVSSDDKLKVARQLDHLGVHWIEGGWPGSNPKDEEFFQRAATELELNNSQLVAFGSTRRPKGRVDEDQTLSSLVEAGTSTVCIVGKSWDYHVTEALRQPLDEGVAMVGDSVEFLKAEGLRVFFDAEHFFDGYKRNPEFSLQVLEAAAVQGADCLVLCDTNGGSLPHEVEKIVADVVRHFDGVQIGMHTQNDTGCAVANAVAGVVAGATHVQGTINGYGERTGNCDNTVLVPNLTLKMGIETLPEERIERLTSVSHHVAELMNMPPQHQQPYVGTSAFAHKAGLHTSAIARRPDSYEHVDPSAVGNSTRFLLGDLSGRASVELKAEQLGIEIEDKQMVEVVEEMKRLEHEGYHFEVADASLELMMRRAAGEEFNYFDVESFRVLVERGQDRQFDTEATLRIVVDGERMITVGEGDGPVNALDNAFRNAVIDIYPELSEVHLTDYKVRVLDTNRGTGAVTRVLVDSADSESTWTTIGVSENIIEASWLALRDALVYALYRHRAQGDSSLN
ncbi:MAG: citramalate synthase [Acidimicrobiales bacterium]|jgi:2-isopropylmalate synthase|nr:citramalate synthase [Acidimicrobiales bacterium]MDP6901182.1 citramalate synthase [Acidimicrobiales bacterium]HJL99364.1 citramalate synthase [Acidimicrobiales bacterium]